jgi:anthranilate synthase/aminodeoxychorismate synthase-like glutamine amidotransferase
MIDHNDSFTDTIVSYFLQLGVWIEKIHYLDPVLDHLDILKPSAIILSPGPGHPREAQRTLTLIRNYYQYYPILGVCLGMQAIAMAFGADVISSSEVAHGKISPIYHQQTGLFQDLPTPFLATRYHSLMVDLGTLSSLLVVDAWTFDSQKNVIPMGLRHIDYPIFGLQFHPEAVLSEHGLHLFSQFSQL